MPTEPFLHEEPQTPDQRGHPPQHRNRRQQHVDARVLVVLGHPFLVDAVVYFREAELGRVEADGVIEGREAVVAVLDELDVGALVNPVSFISLRTDACS